MPADDRQSGAAAAIWARRLASLGCTCPADGSVCYGEGHLDDPGTCQECFDTDGEEHCHRCPCEGCTDAR